MLFNPQGYGVTYKLLLYEKVGGNTPKYQSSESLASNSRRLYALSDLTAGQPFEGSFDLLASGRIVIYIEVSNSEGTVIAYALP